MIATLSPQSINVILGISFATLVLSVLVWFVLISRLHRILRTRHSETYDRLGRPTLFLNNSVQNGIATIRFLLGGHFRQLNDPELLRLGAFMQVFFFVYVVFIICLVALMFTLAPTSNVRGQ